MRQLSLFLAIAGLGFAQQNKPIGQLQSSDASVRGAVVISASSTQVMSGSQVTAGGQPATIRLTRGGELRLCPNTSISLSASTTGKEHLVGLNAGAVEAHYTLSSHADTIVTPDFRIQLPGPGTFDFAFGISERGDVCVESLKGNSSSVVVSEQFGDGTHQVRPGERLLFTNGRVADPSRDFTAQCGCPAAPAMEATKREFGFPEQQSREAAAAIASGKAPESSQPIAPAPAPSNANQTYVQVDAPIVFRGDQLPASGAFPASASSAFLQGTNKIAPTMPVSLASAELAFPEGRVREVYQLFRPEKKKWYQRLGDTISGWFR